MDTIDGDILKWIKQDKEYNEKYEKIPISGGLNPNLLKVNIVDFSQKRKWYFGTPNIVVEYSNATGTKKFETTKGNERFRFVLPNEDMKNDYSLKFTLVAKYRFKWDTNEGEVSYDASYMKLNEKVDEVISFSENDKLKVRISKKKKQYVRLSMSLCEKEMDFRSKRIQKVMRSFQRALGSDKSPNNIFETPVMSLVASGGGLRAATAMCGVTEGLDKIGLLDCMMYSLGTSGGAWYLASLYAKKAFKGNERNKYHSFLRRSMETFGKLKALKYSNIMSGLFDKRKETCQPVASLVTWYGNFITDQVFYEGFSSAKLSDLQSYVETAEVPYVILNSIQADEYQDVLTYQADCNLTPFECEMPQYGVNVDTKCLDSLFYSGVMERQLPEPDLSYIIGILGSCFGLEFNRMADFTEYSRGLSSQQSEDSSMLRNLATWISTFPIFRGRDKFFTRSGKIWNFAHGFNDMQRYRINPLAPIRKMPFDGFKENDDTLNLIDGGILCNIAIGAALRPQRRNDILFVADITSYDEDISFSTLTTSIKLAKEGGFKFPPVDLEKIKSDKTKEFYVFEDENDPECPLVFWLLTTTDRFKQIPNYTPKDASVLKNLREGEKFNDFDVIESDTYHTFNFRYSNLDFDRLRELMVYNITVNEEIIKRKIRERIERGRSRS